jgi:hypothetical protein
MDVDISQAFRQIVETGDYVDIRFQDEVLLPGSLPITFTSPSSKAHQKSGLPT